MERNLKLADQATQPASELATIEALSQQRYRNAAKLRNLQQLYSESSTQLQKAIETLIDFNQADEAAVQVDVAEYVDLLVILKEKIRSCQRQNTQLNQSADAPELVKFAPSGSSVRREYQVWLDHCGINHARARAHVKSWLKMSNDQFEISLQLDNFANTELDGYEGLDLCIEVLDAKSLRRLLDKVNQGLHDQQLQQSLRCRLESQLDRLQVTQLTQ